MIDTSILADLSKLAAHEVLVQLGHKRATMTLKEAYALYSRRTVDDWQKRGLIQRLPRKTKTSPIRYETLQLITADLNRKYSYYTRPNNNTPQ